MTNAALAHKLWLLLSNHFAFKEKYDPNTYTLYRSLLKDVQDLAMTLQNAPLSGQHRLTNTGQAPGHAAQDLPW